MSKYKNIFIIIAVIILGQITGRYLVVTFFDSKEMLNKTNLSQYEGHKLAQAYEYGIGVEKDLKKAFIHYEKSAAAGVYSSAWRMGLSYLSGDYYNIDFEKAYFYIFMAHHYLMLTPNVKYKSVYLKKQERILNEVLFPALGYRKTEEIKQSVYSSI